MSQQKSKKTLINWDLVSVNPNDKNWNWKDLFCLIFADSPKQYKTKIYYCPYKRVGNQSAILGNIIIKTSPITCKTINCIIP